MGMSIVLECRNLHKRFAFGFGSCGATAHVLRGVDLAVHAGDCIAILGSRAAGKSTLLLCAAGLLKPDAGDVRWFGQTTLPQPGEQIAYHWTTATFPHDYTNDDVRLHLIDFAVASDARVAQWIEARRERGDAIVFGTRDESVARALASKVAFLRSGRLQPAARPDVASRVAEPVA
jgi:ABC-type multidrug transport system ATPase subunit